MAVIDNKGELENTLKRGRPKTASDKEDILSTPAINIRNIREMVGMSRKEFAALTKIGESTINFYETNPNANISYDCLKKITAGLSRIGICCSMESFYETGTLTPYFTHDFFMRFLSYRKGKAQIHSPELNQEQIIRYEVANFLMHNPNATSVIVSNNTMEPLFSRGDVLGAVFVESEDIRYLISKLCVLVFKDPAYPSEYGILQEVSDEEIVLKLINPDSSGGLKVFLHKEIDKMAEVIWIRKKKHR